MDMTERIRSLVAQAGTDTSGKWISIDNAEKFAELIVRECLDVIAMRIYLGPVEICRQECKALASEIKEHFGVEP